MVLSIVDSTMSGVSDNSAESDTCPAPAGVAADDWIYLTIEMWWGTTTNPTVTWPAGFTERVNIVSTTDGFQKFKVARKKSTGSEPANYSMTWSGNHWVQSQAVAVRGADTSEPEDGSPNTASNTTGTGYPANSKTTSVACMMLHICANENSSTPASTSPPTGYTEREDANYLHINTKLQGAAGTENISGGGLSASTQKMAALIAVKEAGGAGPTNLVIQDMSVGVSHDAPTITRIIPLTVADMSVGTSIDNLTVNSATNLAIQDLSVAIRSDVPTLTRIMDLAIQKMLVATRHDTPNFTQIHTIAIHDMFLQTAADIVNFAGGSGGGPVSIADLQAQKLPVLTGQTGSVQDLLKFYYGGLSGLAPATSYSIADHQRVYWETQTGLSGRSLADLEKAFYDAQLVPSGSLADRAYVYWSGL